MKNKVFFRNLFLKVHKVVSFRGLRHPEPLAYEFCWGQIENGQTILQKFILVSSECRHLQGISSPESLTRGFALDPTGASSQTISIQARSNTLARILPSYIMPSRSLRSSSTTIFASLRKTSIATPINLLHPLHLMSGISFLSMFPLLDAACFQKASTIYSFMPTLDSPTIKVGINEVHQKDTISLILWYSDWLYNITSAGNSIFVTNHKTTSGGRSIM